MAVLPPSSDFTGSTVTEGQFKTALTGLRDFLSGLLGADGLTATALASLGAMGAAIVAKTAAYTVVVGDRGKVLDCSNTWTLTLPAAATAGTGFSLLIRNGGSGIITLDPNAAELINGASTVPLAAGQSTLLVCTGTAWVTVGAVGSDAAAFLAITGTALQSALDDTTVGRIMKVGAFGWGINNTGPTALTDLDANRVSGLFFWASTATGAPEVANGVVLHMTKFAGVTQNGSQQQIAFSASGTVFFRSSKSTGLWSAWTSLLQVSTAGLMTLAGNATGALAITIADDAVGIITTPRQGGFADITCAGATASPLPDFSGQVYFDAGTTLQIIKGAAFTGLSAFFNVVATDVLGTTGTDAYVTVAVQAGVLKIENRSGAARTFQVTFS
ncbi:hypothetical protein [Cypionkella psychrotolerans]|uniref:hypothetical protein n=1 Tax=Cypionkella psychrotolerans TaxID=1678131 RepID=UPI0006B50AB4|nr:hypothetical protein [Cypionkella psychrotolerans]